jgi:hypothetical protein
MYVWKKGNEGTERMRRRQKEQGREKGAENDVDDDNGN